MENEMLINGVLAIVGSLAVAVGDSLLLGNPVSGKTFRAQGLDNLLHVSPKNMLIGHTLGVLTLPLLFFGVFQVYRGLEPAGLAYALPPVLIMTYALVVGAAGHACFAYLGGALQLQRDLQADTHPSIETLVTHHKRLLYPLFGAFIAGLVLSSFWFSYVVWTQPTLYPTWVALTNPFILIILFAIIVRFLPAPIGGYIRPATANLAFAGFFTLSTLTLI